MYVLRENCTAATVQDLPAPPPIENIRNKKCQVSLGVPGHVAAQAISTFLILPEAFFPDNSSRSIQTQTVPCDMPAIALLASEEQEPNVQPDVECLHQQDLRRGGSRESSSVCILAVPKASPGSMISPVMKGNLKGMYLNVRCAN